MQVQTWANALLRLQCAALLHVRVHAHVALLSRYLYLASRATTMHGLASPDLHSRFVNDAVELMDTRLDGPLHTLMADWRDRVRLHLESLPLQHAISLSDALALFDQLTQQPLPSSSLTVEPTIVPVNRSTPSVPALLKLLRKEVSEAMETPLAQNAVDQCVHAAFSLLRSRISALYHERASDGALPFARLVPLVSNAASALIQGDLANTLNALDDRFYRSLFDYGLDSVEDQDG